MKSAQIIKILPNIARATKSRLGAFLQYTKNGIFEIVPIPAHFQNIPFLGGDNDWAPAFIPFLGEVLLAISSISLGKA